MKTNRYVLGAGITGLATGMASDLPVLEAAGSPGGICSSYYRSRNNQAHGSDPPDDDEAYRFEIGGGHWIFGGSAEVQQELYALATQERHWRRSSVYFRATRTFVPYPLQNHLRFLGPELAQRAVAEMSRPSSPARTLAQWLEAHFGPTLCNLFFTPFNKRYTAGLLDRIAPQDAYKSPVDLDRVRRGARVSVDEVGYNATFLYPAEGLNRLVQAMATRCQVQFNKRVAGIDTEGRILHLADGNALPYDEVISTLPLNQIVEMAGISLDENPDPYTSVLVLNIGAVRGPACPDDHWLYTPDADSGFHRVGFYSNVSRSFLPASARSKNDRVAIYVERAFPGGRRPASTEIDAYAADVAAELQRWGFIGNVDVIDPTFIDVAYTWSWPESTWRKSALDALRLRGIHSIGRYGRWIFQGIADSMEEGLQTGRSFS